MPRASIDIGSNSLLLLVVDDQGVVLHDEARVVGLGRGLGERGLLRADRLEEALAVLHAYAQRAESLGAEPAQLKAVATSALRRALNAQTFCQRVQASCGFPVRIISGEEEAGLTAAGALSGLNDLRSPVLVADPGGGSTELIGILSEGRASLAGPGSMVSRRSVEVGTVRLRESHLSDDPIRPRAVSRAREAIARAFGDWRPAAQPRTVVAVAGTATSLAAAELGLAQFDGGAVHGHGLDLFTMRAWVDRLLHADAAQRRALFPATPARADTMLPGILILEHILLRTQRTGLVVSSRGVRFGLIC